MLILHPHVLLECANGRLTAPIYKYAVMKPAITNAQIEQALFLEELLTMLYLSMARIIYYDKAVQARKCVKSQRSPYNMWDNQMLKWFAEENSNESREL